MCKAQRSTSPKHANCRPAKGQQYQRGWLGYGGGCIVTRPLFITGVGERGN
jgi:hypothetical protein